MVIEFVMVFVVFHQVFVVVDEILVLNLFVVQDLEQMLIFLNIFRNQLMVLLKLVVVLIDDDDN
jgi:hypothetical protein